MESLGDDYDEIIKDFRWIEKKIDLFLFEEKEIRREQVLIFTMQIEGYEAELKTLFGKLIKDEIIDSYIHPPPPEEILYMEESTDQVRVMATATDLSEKTQGK